MRALIAVWALLAAAVFWSSQQRHRASSPTPTVDEYARAQSRSGAERRIEEMARDRDDPDRVSRRTPSAASGLA